MRCDADILKQIDFCESILADRRRFLEENVGSISPEMMQDVLSTISVNESWVQALKWCLQ